MVLTATRQNSDLKTPTCNGNVYGSNCQTIIRRKLQWQDIPAGAITSSTATRCHLLSEISPQPNTN